MSPISCVDCPATTTVEVADPDENPLPPEWTEELVPTNDTLGYESRYRCGRCST